MSKKKLTYSSAFEELTSISAQLESETVDIDEITTLVKRANELVTYCQNKLRGIEEDLNDLKKEKQTEK